MAEQVPKIEGEFSQMISKTISGMSGRVRLLEERTDQLRQKAKIIDENMIDKTDHLKEEITKTNARIDELIKEIKVVKENMERLIKEIGNVATVQDVKVLEKYINMIDPTRFLTKEEVVRIVKKEVGRS
jgi:uncharacterized protein YoxC